MEREEDLIEEVARIAGYDKIPELLPPAVSAGEYLPFEDKRRALRRSLAAQGFDEAIKFSFISDARDETLEFIPALVEADAAEPFVTLSNSIIEGSPRMRPSLLPGLLEATRLNFNQGLRNVRLFETGRVFAKRAGESLPEERESLALLLTGQAAEEGKSLAQRELDFFDLKGAVAAGVAAMGLPELVYEAVEAKHLREGQAARLLLPDGRAIGFAGRLSEQVSAIYKFRQAVYLAELDLANLLRAEPSAVRYSPLPKVPAITRDLSLLLNRRVTWAELRQTISELNLVYCRNIELADVYEGANVPAGQRSVTIRLEYRDAERTLRDEEAEAEHLRVVAALSDKFGAQQRA
jgi:phenylalanyl-tRNA synthetase beta chain